MENTKYKDENIITSVKMSKDKEVNVTSPLKVEIEEKKVYISLDNDVENVIKLDKEGKELYFEVGARFNKLSSEVVKGLGNLNKMRYNQAFVETQYESEAKPTESISVTPRFATAKSRMDVVPLIPGIKFCWKRPEETQYAKVMNYDFAIEGKHCRTFATPDGEIPRIGKGGDEELVLLYISKEDHDAIIKAVGDKSKRRNGAVEESAKSKLEQLGGKPFSGSPNTQDWTTLNK